MELDIWSFSPGLSFWFPDQARNKKRQNEPSLSRKDLQEVRFVQSAGERGGGAD